MRRPSRARKAGTVAVLSLLACGLLWADRRESRARAAASAQPSLPLGPRPGPGERLLVFAPHPDDETLAAGGLIYEARRRGADVRVVFLTSGDGFALCALTRYRRPPGQGALRRLGRERRQEALTALRCLGVSPEQVTFLGYPDRGLNALRGTQDAAPYRSPFTGWASVRAPGCFRPGAPYTGEALSEDLDSVLARRRPDFVLYPAPDDDHADHRAAGRFIEEALGRWGRVAPGSMPRARTYLIHRGEWPQPRGEATALYLTPPPALVKDEWETAAVSPEALAAKRAALGAHGSQLLLAGRFLRSFLRRNELFRR